MKEKFEDILDFLKKPNLTFKIISYVLFFVFSTLAVTFSCLSFNTTLLSCLYGGMGVTFFYCAYLFIKYDAKKIRIAYKKTRAKLSNKSRFLNKVFNDVYFRTMFTTSFSLLLSVCFVSYNAFTGIYYHSIWNGSISIYYGLLVLIKILFLAGEYNISHSKKLDEKERELKRIKMFKFESILLFFVNIALIVPVTLLALSQKEVSLPMWIAIADACYTFYKMTICIRSFIKTRKNDNLSIVGIKNLNMISACVSLLSLENTMIITFSDTIESGLKILIILSAFAVVVTNLWIATITYLRGKKELNQINENIRTN